jgi:hypothetical protein
MLVAVSVVLVTVASAQGTAWTTGSERFDGGLVVTGASGARKVAGSVIAMSGVFNGVGRIVERPNRPGDSGNVDRDDLVFAAGTLHVKSANGHMSVAVNRRTCKATFKIQKTTTVEGGTRRFATATGTFAGAVTGWAVAGRQPDGSCDQRHPALVEVDTVTATGTLTV